MTGRNKSIHQFMQGDRSPELYDIVADPFEETDLAETDPTRVAELAEKIEARFKDLPIGN